MGVRIISYNVNGLRAAVSKGLTEWITAEDPDIICIQETKLQQGQIDSSIFEKIGYKHHYWHYAQKKGYSGVALFSKEKPLDVHYGIGSELFDKEGRTVIALFKDYSVLSVYFPSGTSGDERQDFKMKWLDAFFEFILKFRGKYPNLIICGDFNICHKPIDINYPERHETYSGFLPEEREWLDKFTQSGFVDSFRVFDQRPNQYSWWSYRANSREKNLGWRIDYNFVTESLKKKLTGASILTNIVHSDHCPVKVELEF